MNKQALVILLVSLVAMIAVSWALWSPSNNEAESTDARNPAIASEDLSSSESNASLSDSTNRYSKTQSLTQTFADTWQWRDNDADAQEEVDLEETASLPFTDQSVHDALQQVKIDEDGNVILDHEALVSLDEALERIYNRLDAESMLKLEELIKESLPGKTGVQTANLVRNYQQFLQAKEQFYQVNSTVPSGPQTVQSIESDQLLYAELQALREIHLGQDVTESLFHESDVNAEYMFESIKLGLQSGLTNEEISARRAAIENRRREQLGEPEPEEVDI